jgi:hypothetical protein
MGDRKPVSSCSQSVVPGMSTAGRRLALVTYPPTATGAGPRSGRSPPFEVHPENLTRRGFVQPFPAGRPLRMRLGEVATAYPAASECNRVQPTASLGMGSLPPRST